MASNHQSPPLARLRDFFGLERNLVVMVLSILVIGMGEEVWSKFVPKYLDALGATALVVGAYGVLKDGLDAVYQYPGGWLSDRMGFRRALVLFNVLAITGYALYLVADWRWVLAGTLFVAAWSSLSLPATFSVIGASLRRERRAIGFGVQSILKRLPIVIAPAAGGLLMDRMGVVGGVRIGLLITIGLAAAAIWMQLRLYREPPRQKPADDTLRAVWRRMPPGLKGLLTADCMVRMGQGIGEVFIVLYATNVVKVSMAQFGLLTSLRMIVSIATYIPVSKIADRMDRRPWVVLTYAFFALFPVTVALAHNLAGLMVAFAVAGLREIGEPPRKALIVDLSPADARGRSVGLFYLVRGLVVTPAAYFGALLWRVSPALTFWVSAGAAASGLVFYAAYYAFKRSEP